MGWQNPILWQEHQKDENMKQNLKYMKISSETWNTWNSWRWDSGRFRKDLVRKEFRVCDSLFFSTVFGFWAPGRPEDSGRFIFCFPVFFHVFMFYCISAWFSMYSTFLCLGGGVREAPIGPSGTVNIHIYVYAVIHLPWCICCSISAVINLS